MSNFSDISWQKQVIFGEMMMSGFAQDQYAQLDFYSASSLKQPAASH
jgi:hypothetical protein